VATHSESAAGHARTVAAAYEAAHAATVPPPVVTANRAQIVSLLLANVFGQNAPAIAATEAEYERMWAQCVTAMSSYLADAAAAGGHLKACPFAAPPAPRAGTRLAAGQWNVGTTARGTATLGASAIFGSGAREAPAKVLELARAGESSRFTPATSPG
jgi:PPE-repeat protein